MFWLITEECVKINWSLSVYLSPADKAYQKLMFEIKFIIKL